MLARFGPSRSCIIGDCRRSSQVRIEASGIRTPSIRRPGPAIEGDDALKRDVVRRSSSSSTSLGCCAKRSWTGSSVRPHSASFMKAASAGPRRRPSWRLGCSIVAPEAPRERATRISQPGSESPLGANGRPQALDHALAVREGAVDLGPRGQRQRDMGHVGRAALGACDEHDQRLQLSSGRAASPSLPSTPASPATSSAVRAPALRSRRDRQRLRPRARRWRARPRVLGFLSALMRMSSAQPWSLPAR